MSGFRLFRPLGPGPHAGRDQAPRCPPERGRGCPRVFQAPAALRRAAARGCKALFLACLVFCCAAAGPAWCRPPVFQVLPDGTVRAGSGLYPTLSDYYQSDFRWARFQEAAADLAGPQPALAGAPGDCGRQATVIRDLYQASQVYVIPVVFHVITNAAGNGHLSDQQIQDQVRVLNEDFRALAGTKGALGHDTMIRFTLAGVTRTADNAWFQDEGDREYMAALGWDQERYLNIYTNQAYLSVGYACLPHDCAGTVRDGIVLFHETVGGRDQAGEYPYDQGRNAVTMVGHYLGLLKTFSTNCGNGYETGDLLEDTNPELGPHTGCEPSYSCGVEDPIHNYMSAASDSCKTGFTPEQANRMICTLLNYRPYLYRLQNITGPILPLIPAIRSVSGPSIH